MDLDTLTNEFNKRAANLDPVGNTFKFVLDDIIVYIDGTGDSNIISNENKEADCTISTTMENFLALQSGKLNPMMALMMGKVKVEGDKMLAMKLQSLLG